MYRIDTRGVMAIGNMPPKIGKDCACVSGNILRDRQTHKHRHAHHNTSQLATSPVGEVMLLIEEHAVLNVAALTGNN